RHAVSDNSPKADLPRAPLSDPVARSFVDDQLDGDTKEGQTPQDVVNPARNNLVYMDSDGAGSGSNVGATGGAGSAGQAAPAQFLASPDANLKTPFDKEVKQLDRELHDAIQKADAAAKKAQASGKKKDIDDAETARAGVDDVLKKIAKAYGIGQDAQTSLHYDPGAPATKGDVGETRGTDTSVYKGGLTSSAEAAATIMHESNHARRNQQFSDVDWNHASVVADPILKDLGEIEGYSMEVRNAGTLHSKSADVKGAESQRQKFLDDLKSYGSIGKKLADLAEQGRFDEAYDLFRSNVLKKK
ncbi:MAG TPA: hypothetical protein VK466_05700, partial [Terriglobales bacterium]|nr:hypothetical protein [Terriglobales bacterium]